MIMKDQIDSTKKTSIVYQNYFHFIVDESSNLLISQLHPPKPVLVQSQV